MGLNHLKSPSEGPLWEFPQHSRPPPPIHRVDPLDARMDNLPLLQGIPVKQAERKVEEIHKGALLARERPPFPESRPLQDVAWAAAFVLAVAAAVFGAVWFSAGIEETTDELGNDLPAVRLESASEGMASVCACSGPKLRCSASARPAVRGVAGGCTADGCQRRWAIGG